MVRLPRPAGPATLTFLGAATALLRIGRFTLLTDPSFHTAGRRAYLGRGLWTRRRSDPALGVQDLPALDAVVVSHLHGDHFDRVARRDLPRSTPVVTTPHAASRLRRAGFEAVGLHTWQRHVLSSRDETLTIEALPAVHAYGVLQSLLPPGMGSLLEHRAGGRLLRRLYLSGDTLTGPHLTKIASRHPDIDVAVVHLGGERLLGRQVSLDAAGGVELIRTVRAAVAVPVHHDDFAFYRDPLSAFLLAAHEAGLDQRVRTVERGQTVNLARPAVVDLRDEAAQEPSATHERGLHGYDTPVRQAAPHPPGGIPGQEER
jgi:L-ascorbate metabolism protein UlaG (beta-lactamase superfamily)